MDIKEGESCTPSSAVGLLQGTSNCLSNCCSKVPESLLVADTEQEDKVEKEQEDKTRGGKGGCSTDCNRKTSQPDEPIIHSSSSSSSSRIESVNSNVDHRATSAAVASTTPTNLHHHQMNVDSSHHHHHRLNDCISDSSASSGDHDGLLLDDGEVSFSADDREFDFLLKAPLLPRSSSLKSRKTPPSTPPTRRKSVRFADALGLDLELVRHILNPDDPPHVPLTAVRFLQSAEPLKVVSYWRVSFAQPATNESLTQRVLQKKVSLESCTINNSSRQVNGTIRVANISYEKDVRVRYTVNGWLTWTDVEATYIEHSNDLITDRFAFQLTIPQHLLHVARSRLEFAVRLSAANQTFWDNNTNNNYALQCVEYQTV